MMHVQQGQFTTGLEQATRVDREPDDPRDSPPPPQSPVLILSSQEPDIKA